jgi:hypothetical protein
MRRPLIASLLPLAVLVACSDSKSVGSATTVSTVETPATTEGAAATTAAPATTSAAEVSTTATLPPTTTVAVAELVLGTGGVGPFDLGADATPVIDGLSASLGAPVTDQSADYPMADGLGAYTTASGDMAFVAPKGRTVCWSVNLCADFGGASAGSMSFTGWSYANDPTGTLRTESGATIGSRWSDQPTIELGENSCYSIGYGTLDGIAITLESSGDMFSGFDANGNFVETSPDPADVTIIAIETGKLPVAVYGDC